MLFIAAQKRNGIVRMPNGDPVAFFRKHASVFPFLLDEDRVVTHRYGVYKAFSIDSIRIARPSTFVVGRDGKIHYIYVGENQVDRAPMAEVLAQLRELSL